MMNTLWKHADGGHYIVGDDDAEMKDPATGQWVPAVIYRAVETADGKSWTLAPGKALVMTKDRWNERFTEVGE